MVWCSVKKITGIVLPSPSLSPHLRMVLQSGLFPSGSPNKILYEFIISHVSAIYLTRLILDFITLNMFDEEDKL